MCDNQFGPGDCGPVFCDMSVVNENKRLKAEIERLRAEVERLKASEGLVADVAHLVAMSGAMSHVIIEHGITPGRPATGCRCDECRMVAAAMYEAGYLDDVDDRWWEEVNPDLTTQ